MKTTTPPAKARRLEEIADSKKGLFAICPTLLSVEPGFNKRENFGDLQQLADDIAANGLDQPLKIRKVKNEETIFIVSGHRRHKAITEILIPAGRWQDPDNPKKIRTVDCYAEPQFTTRLDRLVSQVCGNTGLAYTLLEKAAVYQEILVEDPTLKPADLARRFGESKQAVSDALRLTGTGSPALLAAVRSGTMAASTAIAIIKQAGTDHSAQDAMLQSATAAANGASHITPKHIPTPEPEPSTTPEPPPAPSSPPAPPAPSDQSNQSDPPPQPSPSFTLYVVTGAPEEPLRSAPHLYHETDRLVLEHSRHFGLDHLHLLCAATSFGPAYGYRMPEHEHLPDVSADTLNCDPQEGFNAVLELACRKAGLTSEQQEELSNLLYDALCDYFPETGTPKSPCSIPFAGASPAQSPGTTPDSSGRTGFDAIRNAPSGGGGGGGGSSYLDPQTFKAVEKIETVLESLAEKNLGIPERVTTADILVGVLRNERPASDLKNYLLGK